MRAASSLLTAIALALTGCGSKAQQAGGVPRRGLVPKIVSLSPSTTEIVANQLNAQMLVGRGQSDDYPKNILSVPVMASVKPDFEKIKGSGATDLVYDADLYSPDDVKRIEAMGIHPFAFKAHTVAGFEKELYELSGLMGSETNMSAYVDRIERERGAAEGDPPSPRPKVAVVLGGGDYVAGTDSFVADAVRIAGGDAVGPKSEKFEAASPEAMVAAAPDMIILATSKDNGAKDLAALRSDPRFTNSPAVKNGRVTALNQDVVVRRGSRVDTLISQLHRALTLKQGT